MRLAALALIFVVLASTGAGAVVRTDTVYDGITGSQMAAVFRANGFPVDLQTDDYGDPAINSSVGGLNFYAEFYDCEGAAQARTCKEILFKVTFSGVSVSPARINEWNRDRVDGQAYLEENGDAGLAMWFIVGGGASDEQLASYLSWWTRSISDFADHVGFVRAPGT